MITITQYLQTVYESFSDYLTGQNNLCLHRGLNYHLAEFPDYNNPRIQEHYILRYTYAYAFEYRSLYKKCFEREQVEEPTIRILAIGCGNAIDYWSAVCAAESLHLTCKIDYTGVDECCWGHVPEHRSKDSINILQVNAVDYLRNLEQLNFHYIMFPKSISEFSPEEFSVIRDVLKTIKINGKRIELLASFRSSPRNCEADQDRFIRLVNDIKANKSHNLKLRERKFDFFTGKDMRIKELDPTFIYPREAREQLMCLHDNCAEYQRNQRTCRDCENLLDRQPLLSAREIRLGRAAFEKEIKY